MDDLQFLAGMYPSHYKTFCLYRVPHCSKESDGSVVTTLGQELQLCSQDQV